MRARLILCDVDNVLLDWSGSFELWVQKTKGVCLAPVREFAHHYDVGKSYGRESDEMRRWIIEFNHSGAAAFMFPLRDAVWGVETLHRRYGYSFHLITAMSDNPHAHILRRMNLERLFGTAAIAELTILPLGAAKNDVLSRYKDTGLLWIEDNAGHAISGRQLGLGAVLMDHPYNQPDTEEAVLNNLPRVKDWADLITNYA